MTNRERKKAERIINYIKDALMILRAERGDETPEIRVGVWIEELLSKYAMERAVSAGPQHPQKYITLFGCPLVRGDRGKNAVEIGPYRKSVWY